MTADPDRADGRFRALLETYARPLDRIVASYARSLAERADLRQEIGLALWRALPAFRGESSERTFVLRIAHNRAVTALSKRGPALADVDDHDVAATSGSSPAVRAERGERASRLLRAVQSLPLGQRQVITLLLEDLTLREVAEVLGTSENVVTVRASRARATLRVLLDEEGEAK